MGNICVGTDSDALGGLYIGVVMDTEQKGKNLTKEHLGEAVKRIKAHPAPEFDGIIVKGKLAGRLVKKVNGEWVMVGQGEAASNSGLE